MAKETEQSSSAKSKETKGSDSDAKEDGKCGNPKNGRALSIVYWQTYSSSTETVGKESYS
jgi:hypothetical protein